MYMFAAVIFGATVSLAVPLEVSSSTNTYPVSHHSDPFGPLTFRADGTFQISVFEDLHFGESMFTPQMPLHLHQPLTNATRCLGSMGPAAGY